VNHIRKTASIAPLHTLKFIVILPTSIGDLADISVRPIYSGRTYATKAVDKTILLRHEKPLQIKKDLLKAFEGRPYITSSRRAVDHLTSDDVIKKIIILHYSKFHCFVKLKL